MPSGSRKRELQTSMVENVPPHKRMSLSTTAANDLEVMVERLRKKRYDYLLEEMNEKPSWESRSFRERIVKYFGYCAFEGYTVAKEYEKLCDTYSKLEEKYSSLNETLQDHEQHAFEAEENAAASERKCEEQKEELDAAHTMIEKLQYKIRLLEKENANVKEELYQEKKARKLAEKEGSETKTKAAEEFAKWTQEYQEKNNLTGMKENIDQVKNQLVELQTLTATDVIQGIQNLTKNMSSFFPSEKKEGPMWFVKKEICESIYKNAQDEVKPFIANFLPELFKWGELILPENMLNKEKRAELDAVCAYFYKIVGDQQKELFGKLIKSTLEKLRAAGRQKIYSLVRRHGIIGFEPEGSCFFYSREPSGKFIPYSDANYLHPMHVQMRADQTYAIPIEYEAAEFLMVIENSVNNGITYYQIDPKSGYKKLVYSNGRNSKKGL